MRLVRASRAVVNTRCRRRLAAGICISFLLNLLRGFYANHPISVCAAVHQPLTAILFTSGKNTQIHTAAKKKSRTFRFSRSHELNSLKNPRPEKLMMADASFLSVGHRRTTNMTQHFPRSLPDYSNLSRLYVETTRLDQKYLLQRLQKICSGVQQQKLNITGKHLFNYKGQLTTSDKKHRHSLHKKTHFVKFKPELLSSSSGSTSGTLPGNAAIQPTTGNIATFLSAPEKKHQLEKCLKERPVEDQRPGREDVNEKGLRAEDATAGI
ncbi:uncharacterized protein V6R79_010365 [Siganus canaliculatus]